MLTVPSYGDSAYVGPRVATAPLQVSKEQPKDYSTAFGAAEGRALQGVGKQVAQVGDRLGQITTELQIQENEFQVKKAAVALSEGYRVLLDGDGTPENPGYRSLTGEAATKALPEVNARLSELRKNVTENIQGTRAKEMFSEYSAPKEQTAFGVAAAHSLQQGEVAKDAISLARIKSAQSDAAMEGANIPEAATVAANESVILAKKKSQDPEVIAEAATEGRTGVYASAISAAIDRRDPAEAQRLLALYGKDMDGKVAANAAESILLAREQAKARQNAALAQAREDRSLSLINDAVDLRIRASQGEDVSQEALAFRQRYAQDKQGALQTLAIWNAGDETRKKMAAHQALIDKGLSAIKQDTTLDPYNSEDKKAAEVTFSALAQSWAQQQVPPDQVMVKTATFVEQTGIIPETVKQTISGGLNSLDPQTVLSSAGLLDRMTASNPVLTNQFSKEQISLGMDVLDYVKMGAKPEEAIRMVRENRRVPEAQKEARSKEYATLAKGDSPEGRLKQKYSEWFHFDPVASSTMAAEYDKIAKEEYIKTGKLDLAYSVAERMTDRNWGPSAVGDSYRIVKYPPEKLYGLPNMSQRENAQWMQEQLKRDFTGGSPAAYMSEPSPEGLIQPGNIDIAHRPKVRNPDGSISTVRSISVKTDAGEVLLPTVSEDGRIMTDKEAVQQFEDTGRHLGIFKDAKTADAYAVKLHESQAALLAAPPKTLYPPGAENTLIVTPHPTRTTKDGRPKYTVQFQDPTTGEIQNVLSSSGGLMEWTPDYTLSPAYERAKEAQRASDYAEMKAAEVRRQLNTPEGKARVQDAINRALIVGVP